MVAGFVKARPSFPRTRGADSNRRPAGCLECVFTERTRRLASDLNLRDRIARRSTDALFGTQPF